MIGVSFQPGQTSGGSTPQAGTGQKTNGVQEAIKVLSLRLPKVTGAQAVAPTSLLTSAGSHGNSRVDSIVNTVWNRMFPTGAAPSNAPSFGTAPSVDVPQNAPTFGGYSNTPLQRQTPSDIAPTVNQTPRITVDLPPFFGGNFGDFTVGPGGRPTTGLDGSGFPPAMIGTLPSPPTEDPTIKRSPFPDMNWGGGGGGSEPETPYAI